MIWVYEMRGVEEIFSCIDLFEFQRSVMSYETRLDYERDNKKTYYLSASCQRYHLDKSAVVYDMKIVAVIVSRILLPLATME